MDNSSVDFATHDVQLPAQWHGFFGETTVLGDCSAAPTPGAPALFRRVAITGLMQFGPAVETRAWGFGTTPLSQETLLSGHDRDVPLLTWRRSLGGGDTLGFAITGSILDGAAHLELRMQCHVDDLAEGLGDTIDERWQLVVPVNTAADFTIEMTDGNAACGHIWGSVGNRAMT